MWHTPVTVHDLPWCRWICLVEIFSTVLKVSSPELRCAFRIFLFIFLLFSLFFLHKLQGGERRKKNKETKKRLWIHIETPIMTSLVSLKKSRRDKSNDIKKGRAVTGVYHTSRPKANEPWHIWMARVAHFNHCLWPFLVLLDPPRQNLFNSIGDVVIGFSVCLQDFFFCFFVFFLLVLLKIMSAYF